MAEEKKKPTATTLKNFINRMNALTEARVCGQRFYVGHVGMSKLREKELDEFEAQALGLKLIEELTFETAERSSKLSAERLANLDDEVRRQIAVAILKASGAELSCDDPLEGLGQYFREWRAKKDELPQWSGVGETALAAIQQNITGLASTSAALEALRLGNSAQLGLAAAAATSSFDSLKGLKLGSAAAELQLGKLPLSVTSVLDNFESSGLKATDGLFSSISERTANRLELPVIDWSKTPENRAAEAGEQTAERLEHVAELLATMGRELNELTQTIVHTAIPQWMAQVKEEQDASNQALRHASSGLRLTVLALVVSVALSLGQTWLSRLDSIDSDIRADASESLMRRQIDEMRELRDQMAVQSAEQHEQMKALQQLFERLTATPGESSAAPPALPAKL